MLWDAAEAAIKLFVQTQWALSGNPYRSIPLAWENDPVPDRAPAFIAINIEGIPGGGESSIYGSVGARLACPEGIVFYHSFGPSGGGKAAILGPVVALNAILQFQIVSTDIKFDFANPPSPADVADNLQPTGQPGGLYYRVSGSCPFILIGTA